ncbi:Cell division protein FtsX [BD1-7 clade bacterium]|uniref:Cell division protein FtsX n=1 Tax=BD1-7 clade bacterium TaxID=2029982 RepID=A0A5S9N1Z9_9GAMM|nr:Cell division protein FtsX [BD1-7 clade bacterium]CAA0083867.1 Cell division protein FtsX [BD1-7 clade bacterium]
MSKISPGKPAAGKSAQKATQGKTESGAKTAHIGVKARFQAYLKDHQRVMKESLKRLYRQPTNSMLTWCVIGIALALPVGLYLALGNIQALGQRFEGNAQISLFLDQKLTADAQQQLVDDLQQWQEIATVSLITKEQALEEFMTLSGYSDVLDRLDTNPLPAVIEISPIPLYNEPENAQKLLQRLQELPAVDMAQLDLAWVQRLAAMLKIGQRIALGLVILLSAGVLLIIGNTIRLEIESRRDEIIVAKLVGATDAFVRRPFLYTGLWYGTGGGAIATVIIAFGLSALNGPVAELAGLYESDHRLLGLNVSDVLSLWCMGAMLGLAGAWFSVTRHLSALEPR